MMLDLLVAASTDPAAHGFLGGFLPQGVWSIGELVMMGGFCLAACVVLIALARYSRDAAAGRSARSRPDALLTADSTVRQLSVLLDMIEAPAAIADRRGNITWANAPMARQLDVAPAAVHGVNISHLMLPGAEMRDLSQLGPGCDGLVAVVIKPANSSSLRMTA
ncbi:MAG: PAS domain-containing protein [Phycisphaerales bacterium]|jgi:PAS domain-containing protein